jgi:hypothetical protein
MFMMVNSHVVVKLRPNTHTYYPTNKTKLSYYPIIYYLLLNVESCDFCAIRIMYSRIPLIRANWDSEKSGSEENPDN